MLLGLLVEGPSKRFYEKVAQDVNIFGLIFNFTDFFQFSLNNQFLGISWPVTRSLANACNNGMTGKQSSWGILARSSHLREVWKVKFNVQTILMSAWGTRLLITVLWKHKSCLFSFHFSFVLLIMPSMKTTLLKEFYLQML